MKSALSPIGIRPFRSAGRRPGRASRPRYPFSKHTSNKSVSAFTLLELLVVLAIIGIMSAISLPAMKGIGKSNTLANANRQLLDDIALARQLAIKDRTTVHILFVPTNMIDMVFTPSEPRILKLGERLKSGQFTSYALFADRTVGDQPGQAERRYITSWRTLPDGVFISENEFIELGGAQWNAALATPETRPFKYGDFPFPTAKAEPRRLPHVAFDSQGSVVVVDSNNNRVISDEVITLARGSILYHRDERTGYLDSFDVRESPPNNSIENPNRIRIDGLTGRAKVERPDVQ